MNRFCLLFLILLGLPITSLAEVTVDAVVASVDGKPITLHEVLQRAKKEEIDSLQAASKDPDIQNTIEQIIYEQLIRAEAQQRRLTVTASEVDRYLVEISAQNGLSPEEFTKALIEQGNSLEAYKKQIEVDILRSKLVGTLFRNGVGVSDDEIDRYISEHPEFQQSGTKLKLRQILIAREGKDEEKVTELLSPIVEEQPSPEAFAQYAEKYSESYEAKDGGLLGILHENELSPAISNGVASLSEGETSPIVETPAGFHLFLLEKKYLDEDGDSESIRKEVRKILQDIKTREKMQSFITDELYDRHAVDKKI